MAAEPNNLSEAVTRQLEARWNHADQRRVFLCARSPASAIVGDVWANLERLSDARFVVSAVFGKAALHRDIVRALAQYAEIFGDEAAMKNIRIARFTGANDTTEQLFFGAGEVWNGGAMKLRASASPLCAWSAGGSDTVAASAALAGQRLIAALSDPLRPSELKAARRELERSQARGR
jgi:hypothetical protein